MRLWTVHPRYLDTKGLLAAWREALLAQKVLQGQTVGYRNHPQLRRFLSSADPVAAIGAYLHGIYQEALQRGYLFRLEKIARADFAGQIPCTRGQLLYEWRHLREKLKRRDTRRYAELENLQEPEPHPLFSIVAGDVEDWEVRSETEQEHRMNVLVLCDDYWHPAQTPRQGLAALSATEFTFDWIEDARDWSMETMLKYPVVVLTKSNNVSATDKTEWMTSQVEAAFAEYVQQGNGLLAIHSGTAEYEQKPVLRSLLGGVFAHHPDQCPVTVEPRAGHPLTTGSNPFTMTDEHYFMAMDNAEVDVFAMTRSEYGEQPGGWRRIPFGETGRVAVLTPGHNLEVWLHPSFQALVLNCLRWCGKLI